MPVVLSLSVSVVQLRSLYRDMSMTVSGHLPVSAIVDSVASFVQMEQRHANIFPVQMHNLEDLVYSIVGTVKLRSQLLIQLQQSDGGTFWVSMEELVINSQCINQYYCPSSFAHTHSIFHLKDSDLPLQPAITVDSAEHTDLLISVAAAPRYCTEHLQSTAPRLLLVTGVAGAGKSTLISGLLKSMPERIYFPKIRSTGYLWWLGQHNQVDIICNDEFEVQMQAGTFLYVAWLPEEPTTRWGLPHCELLPQLPAPCQSGEESACEEMFAVVEEHPAGVQAARAAGSGCWVVHVTLPTIEVMDQRLRMSSKGYEEHQVRLTKYVLGQTVPCIARAFHCSLEAA